MIDVYIPINYNFPVKRIAKNKQSVNHLTFSSHRFPQSVSVARAVCWVAAKVSILVTTYRIHHKIFRGQSENMWRKIPCSGYTNRSRQLSLLRAYIHLDCSIFHSMVFILTTALPTPAHSSPCEFSSASSSTPSLSSRLWIWLDEPVVTKSIARSSFAM